MMTQEQLAEKSGLSLRTIQRIECAEVNPRSDTIVMLANALNVSPTQLADWSVKENANYLAGVNISGLSALVFPLMGVILPLILWFNRRDNIAGLERTAKKVINFQITWFMLFFIITVLIGIRLSVAVSSSELVGLETPGEAFMFLFMRGVFIVPLLVIFNIVMCIVNYRRARRGKEEVYFPAIPFMRY